MNKKAISKIVVKLNSNEFEIEVDNPNFDEIIKYVTKNLNNEITVEVNEQGESFDNIEFQSILEDSISEFKDEVLIVNDEYSSLKEEIECLRKKMLLDDENILID